MNHEVREECRGCASMGVDPSYYNFCMVVQLERVHQKDIISLCPCIDCLVKVTCTHMCEDRINLTSKKKWKVI